MAIIRLQGEKEKGEGVYYEVDTNSTPIGEGGMGKVYAGTSVNTRTNQKRPVAIKFLFMDLPEQAIERARREASIQLRNDNLVEMLGFIETDEDRNGKIVKHYHVVSELLHGVSLADVIKGNCKAPDGLEIPYARELSNSYTKTPEIFAKEVIKAALSGLIALHDAGYIHRDLDPSNIFITEDRHIKIIDFGISKQMKNLTTNDKQLTVAGAFMGKPEYAAPELALGDLKHQNKCTDIYSMGVLLYQCITGKVPFEGTRFDVLDKQIKEKLPVKDIKDKRIRRIIEKACDKRQENRYQTAAEMRVDLESLDVKRAVDPRKRRMIIMLSVLSVLIVGGAIGGFLAYRQKAEEKKAALMEKNYIDSLVNVAKISTRLGDSLALCGFKHDEGFDAELVKAKEFYNAAESAGNALQKKNVNVQLSKNIAKLDTAISYAYTELNEKALLIESDPDPAIAAEGKNIRKRAEILKGLMNRIAK